MKTIFTKATVLWNERELVERECIVATITSLLSSVWGSMNRAVRFVRVETPIITSKDILAGHVAEGFPLFDVELGYLRPETTGGTIAAFDLMYPNKSQKRAVLPVCLWQYGKSFRNETLGGSMKATKLRLYEFYQLEYQLFAPHGTKAPYLDEAIKALIAYYGGEAVELTDDVPHYSNRTVDWEIDGIEVAGLSSRKDFEHGELYEVSIGLDRLTRLRTINEAVC